MDKHRLFDKRNPSAASTVQFDTLTNECTNAARTTNKQKVIDIELSPTMNTNDRSTTQFNTVNLDSKLSILLFEINFFNLCMCVISVLPLSLSLSDW